MRKLITLLIAFFASQHLYATTADSVLQVMQKHIMRSENLKEEREYWIYLPESYHTFSQQRYPVIYLLDADINMGIVTGIQQFLSKGPLASIPQMIIVGICNTDRTRDLTPTHVANSTGSSQQKGGSYEKSGGAGRFAAFLKNELMPVINKHYRTIDYNIFIGHSFGGLTVINTLFNNPDYFNAYLAIDPSLWWDNEVMLLQADAALRKNFKGRQLFITSSNKKVPLGQDTTAEHPGATLRFTRRLLQDKISGLKFEHRYWEDETHGTVTLPSIYQGLKFIFSGYQLNRPMVKQPSLVTSSFKNFSNKLGAAFLPPEYLLDELGQMSLTNADLPHAIEFFKLSTENYPESKHAWISLAEACEKAGLKQEGVIFRKTAINKK